MANFSETTEYNTVSEEERMWDTHSNRTSIALQRVCDPLIAVFGIIGNLISIAVLTRRWMRSSTNYYLTALAVYDTLYLVFAATMTVSDYKEIGLRNWYKNYQYPVGKPLVDIFSNTGVWLTLTFTIERWLCVCHPMRGRLWCTPKRAKYIIIGVCLAAGLITFPEFFEFRMSCEPKNLSCHPHRSTFAETMAYSYGYVLTNQVLFTFMPLILLCAFNTLLIRAVINAAKRRRSMEARQSQNSSNGRSERLQHEQQKVTITLISVVLVFLFCHTPQAGQNIYLYTTHDKNQPLTNIQKYKLNITANIFNMLVMVNAAINFVLYSTFNTKFRKTFKRISIRTYRRLQGRVVGGGDANRNPSDSSSPYRENMTTSTKMTKLASRSTDENLHKLLVVKSDLQVERCGVVSAQTSPIPMIKVSGTLNGGQYMLTPTCDRSPADSENSFV